MHLKYRINSVSSQVPQYPVSNLTANTLGWQSAITPTYPQQITLQFYVPMVLTNIRLLFHQYKIPRRVQVFVKLGRGQPYRKVGFILPNDNITQNHLTTQLKTVFLQFACTHVRFLLYENYPNDKNIFNQVALLDIAIQGSIMNLDGNTGIDLTEESSEEEENVQPEKEVSCLSNVSNYHQNLFADIYAKLEEDKKQAVDREDFQAAAEIKACLKTFQDLQAKIVELEKKKKIALQQEDFDLCHRLKIDITRVKEAVAYHREDILNQEGQYLSQNSYSRVSQEDVDQRVVQTQTVQVPQVTQGAAKISPKMSPTPATKQPVHNKHEQQIVPALLKKINNTGNQQQNEFANSLLQPGKANESLLYNKSNLNDNNSFKKDMEIKDNKSIQQSMSKDSYSSSNNPIIKQTEYIDTNEVSQDVTGNTTKQKTQYKLEPLQQKVRSRLSYYFKFIPQNIWILAYCNHWKAKTEAANFSKSKVDLVETKQEFMAMLELLAKLMSSASNPVLLIETMNLLRALIDKKIVFSLQHLPYFIQEQLIASLLSMLNDTNSKIKELAYTTYLQLPEISFLSIGAIVQSLIRYRQKLKVQSKMRQTKLNLMTKLVQRYPQTQTCFKQIINWTMASMQDPDQKVRTQAGGLMIMLAITMGQQRIMKILSENKPELLQVFLAILNSSVEQSKLEEDFSVEYSSKKSKQQGNSKNSLSVHSNKNNQKSSTDSKKAQKGSYNDSIVHQSQQSKLSHAQIDLSYSQQFPKHEDNINSSQDPGRSRIDQDQIRLCAQDSDCEYCHQPIENFRDHLMFECKLLIYCEQDNSLIYLREFTEHLIKHCRQKDRYQKCHQCGLAFQIDQINPHIGRNLCKPTKGYNWQRCQFCASDVLADQNQWIKHALKCTQLPVRPQNIQHLV